MKIAAFKDYFDTEDNARWNGYDANRRVVSGRLQVACATSYYSLFTKNAHDLRDSQILIEAVQVPNVGNGSTSCSLLLEQDSNNRVTMGWENGQLKMGYTIGGVENATYTGYSAGDHRWWRIRLVGATNAYWETSPDSRTWTVRRNFTIGVNLQYTTILLQAGHWDTEPSPGVFIVDNLNRPTVVAPVESGWLLNENPAVPNAPTGTVVFEDLFPGTSLNTTYWAEQTWASGAVNNELQAYAPGNAHVANNTLTIRATNTGGNWTSGRLHLKQPHHRTYGRFEAWVKAPHAKGAWPAFWLLGTDDSNWPDCGEIDILESVNAESLAHSTVHGGDGNSVQWSASVASFPIDTSQWHLYSMDVRPGRITMYIDRMLVGEVTPADMPDDGVWPFDTNTCFIILNLAVGGDWPGAPDGTTPSTLEMQVREVRIYN